MFSDDLPEKFRAIVGQHSDTVPARTEPLTGMILPIFLDLKLENDFDLRVLNNTTKNQTTVELSPHGSPSGKQNGKGKMKTVSKYLTLIGISAFIAHTSGQTNLNFNGISATVEGAIKLSWNSKSNEIYQIGYATELVDVNLGVTDWKPLYTDYPSHGTNTFVADAGYYDDNPAIVHPKQSPVRFYRVFLVQENDAPTNPTVAITSVTNGASLSGDITIQVVASSSDILSEVKLYIDGEEQWGTLGTTNSGGTNTFIINTCEWPNGSHTIFATAKSQTGYEGVANGEYITYGRSVSPYVNVTFDNLISRFDFSEPFFQPDLGQTQKVSAVFAANVNWTLEIQNEANQDVRYASGSGSSMSFDWDGTGTNGAAIPNGVYSYLLTVQTNGQSMLMSGDSASVAYSMILSEPSEKEEGWYPTSVKEALASGLTSYFHLSPPMPPVVTNVNGKLKIIPWTELYGEQEPIEVQVPLAAQESFLSLLEDGPQASSYTGAASQNTRGPKRKPRVGVKGEVGTFGICYLTYGTNGATGNHPLTGWPFPLPTYVAIDGQTRIQQTANRPLPTFKLWAESFSQIMQQKAWRQSFIKRDGQWDANTVKKSSLGGQSIFNTVNFGILMTHGSFGNDGSAGTESDGIRYTYNNLGPNTFVRLSDYDFGSAGTNGLRWMTIMACNIMRPQNYASMNNAGKIPVNDDLHLLLGPSTTAWSHNKVGKYYASYLVYTNQTIVNALAGAMADGYSEDPRGITNIIRIGISGWNSCFGDTLQLYNDPDLNSLQYNERTCYIP